MTRDDEDYIDQLVHAPPKIDRSRAQFVLIGLVLLSLIVSFTAITVVVVRTNAEGNSTHRLAAQTAQLAAQTARLAARTAQVAACINTDLGLRGKPSAADATATGNFAHALKVFVSTPSTETPKQKQQAVGALVGAITTWAATLAADAATRAANPLGQC